MRVLHSPVLPGCFLLVLCCFFFLLGIFFFPSQSIINFGKQNCLFAHRGLLERGWQGKPCSEGCWGRLVALVIGAKHCVILGSSPDCSQPAE